MAGTSMYHRGLAFPSRCAIRPLISVPQIELKPLIKPTISPTCA